MQQITIKKRNKLFPLLNIMSCIAIGLGTILIFVSLIYSIAIIVKEDFHVGLLIFVFSISVSILIVILGVIARLLSKMIEQNQKTD